MVRVAIVFASANTVHAQDIAGNYRLTNDSTSAEVPEWGSDCGQRPESHRGSTGRTVRVSMDGNNVVIEDRPRMRSDGCWSQNPRVRRTGGGGSSPRWTSQCSTPADDYQHEEATYTTSIEGGRIVLHDRTQYSWHLRTSNCRASLTRAMTYERVDAPSPERDSGVAPPPVVRDSGVTRIAARCAVPGPGARLAINNGRRSTAPGTRVCFRAQVLDGDGCLAINSTSAVITWAITKRNGEAVPGEGGCLAIPPNTLPNTEYVVTASANGFEDRLILRVVSAEEFRSLVAQTIEEEDAGAPILPVRPTVTDAVGEIASTPSAPPPKNSGTRNILVALLATLSIILLGVVAWLGLRKKPIAKLADDFDEEPTRLAVTPLATVTPSDGQPRPPRERKNEIPMSPKDMPIGGLPPMSSALPQQNKRPPNHLSKVMVTPIPPSSVVAPVQSSAKPAVDPRQLLTKRCPTCDQRFSEENAFCPEHGTALVHVQPAATPAQAVAKPVDAQRSAPRNERIQKQTMIAGSAGTGLPQQQPQAQPAPSIAEPPAPTTLRCTICGKTFGPENVFCGEDGGRLERV